MSTPTAAWSVDTLVGSLARAGWGVLEGHKPACKTILNGLVALLPHGSAAGKITLGQICDATGLKSERWVSRCLRILESLGLVEWTPGGVVRGKSLPGFIRVVKTALALAVRRARRSGRLDERRRARADALRRRIEQAGTTTLLPQRRLSVHASLSDAPHFHREETSPRALVSPSRKAHDAMNEPPILCAHGFTERSNCPDCQPSRPFRRIPIPRPSTKAPKCAACSMTRTAHDKANALVPPEQRHDWIDR